MSLLAQLSRGFGLPGRDHGGEPLHPGCAAEKGGSTPYAEASSPAFLLESLQHSPHVPQALGSNVTMDETGKHYITYTPMQPRWYKKYKWTLYAFVDIYIYFFGINCCTFT